MWLYKAIPKKAEDPEFCLHIKGLLAEFMKYDADRPKIIDSILSLYIFIDVERKMISTAKAKRQIISAFVQAKSYLEGSNQTFANEVVSDDKHVPINDGDPESHTENESEEEYEEDPDSDEEEDKKQPAVAVLSTPKSQDDEGQPSPAKRLKYGGEIVPIKEEDISSDVIVIDDDGDNSPVAVAASRKSEVTYQTVADAEAAFAIAEFKAHLALADAETYLAHVRYDSKQKQMSLVAAKVAWDVANVKLHDARATSEVSNALYQKAQYKAHRLRHDLHRTLHAQKDLVHRLKAQVQAQHEEGLGNSM